MDLGQDGEYAECECCCGELMHATTDEHVVGSSFYTGTEECFGGFVSEVYLVVEGRFCPFCEYESALRTESMMGLPFSNIAGYEQEVESSTGILAGG